MLLFVYGTLKRGGSNQAFMSGQRFVGEACTLPRHRLFDLGGYPGMILDEEQGLCIEGEVWEVDAKSLARLDELEDVQGGEYAREVVRLQKPFDQDQIQGYRYLRSVQGCPDVGSCWHDSATSPFSS